MYARQIKKRYVSVLTLAGVVMLFFASFSSVFAGFGITPPYVKNASLTKNSAYSQTIFLVRSDPVSDLKVEVFLDVPGINEWFTIDKGLEFIMPRGEVKVPMTVQVRVPDSADFENYRGAIRIRTSNAEVGPAGGSVSIALGAQIDVDLTIIDKEIFDFRVRKISVSDVAAGHSLAWLYFPGKITFGITMENTGNIAVAPAKVVFDIYDTKGGTLFESIENTNRMKKVNPFETEEVFAELPTKLPAGSYLARYKIYNLDEIKKEGEVNLSIVPYGSTAAAGYGFFGLSLFHKATIIIPLVVLFLLLFYFTRRGKGKRSR